MKRAVIANHTKISAKPISEEPSHKPPDLAELILEISLSSYPEQVRKIEALRKQRREKGRSQKVIKFRNH